MNGDTAGGPGRVLVINPNASLAVTAALGALLLAGV